MPAELLESAAAVAVEQNPANRPGVSTLTPEHVALVTSKYWGAGGVRLTVQFLDTADAALQARILSHMNAWGESANVVFVQTGQQGQVRIARQTGQGYWSYLGTDILSIPAGQPTMNLEAFGLNTPESEYRRVVRHETGHVCGFPHEHLRKELVARIDPAKAIAYFAQMDGWSAQMVEQQVLTPLADSDLTAAAVDQASIMCYQLPGSITRDGRPIVGGVDIDPEDAAFAAKIYPKAVAPPPPPPPPSIGRISIVVTGNNLAYTVMKG